MALTWLGITGFHVSRTCATIFKAKMDFTRRRLDKKEEGRVSDFNANLNSNYEQCQSERMPLLDTDQKIDQPGSITPFMRALNNA